VLHGWSPEHFRLRDWHDVQAILERFRGPGSVMVFRAFPSAIVDI
jgi:hypothetical protein